MHKLGLGLLVLGSLVAQAEADNFHSVVISSGAFAAFEGTSTDGCVHTSGFFFTDTTSAGPVARVIASSYDSCLDLSGTHVGESPVSASTNGLGSATASGTVVANDYQAQLAPLTFELSLSFTGTGPTIVERSRGTSVSPGGNVTMSFSSSRRRTATVSGSMTVDGGPASFAGAFIGSGISGDLSIAR